MKCEEMNNILIHYLPNGWSKKSCIQSFKFWSESYSTANDLFNITEAAKTFYEGFAKPSESQHKNMPTALATVGNLRE